MKPVNLFDMAFEVGAVRPGVGVNDGVTHFIRRRSGIEAWDFDHPLEAPALERTLGIILYQDQVNEVAMHVAGFSGREADRMRRAFAKSNNQDLLLTFWEKFREGAAARGVPVETAKRIFHKFNGQYMFPEAHAIAFGVTAYQMSWLKLHHPLEFYVGLFNEQPMGFWSPETIKEDAKRHGVGVINPDVERSQERAIIEDGRIRLGFSYVQNMGAAHIRALLRERGQGGPFGSIAAAVERSTLPLLALESLAEAGAFDAFNTNRRAVKWEVGLRYRPPGGNQLELSLSTTQDMADLPDQDRWEVLADEYTSLNLAPTGHVMEELRPYLAKEIVASNALDRYDDGVRVVVAGHVIRRQRPLVKTIFITLEDEFGHTPLIIWPKVWDRLRETLKERYLVVEGRISRREDTLNLIVEGARAIENRVGGSTIELSTNLRSSHDWR